MSASYTDRAAAAGSGDELIRLEKVTVLPVVTEDNRLLDVELAYEPSFDE